ncbi:expressed unknown protein [Seminavis robusta]|uniref:Uncharacterized protein n=1 Tax=Seminavis robusta TaxID=568900 RepID=A0A9N8EW11_9STRA|nr:expressed unknown protein [Seminavis robusta]|eukprot:Sro1987_g309550.1 n/a (564) ;mRNA; r:6463-8154
MMACLHDCEAERQQKSRKETHLIHPREHVAVWVFFAILAIARLRYDTDRQLWMSHRNLHVETPIRLLLGDTLPQLERSIVSYCAYDIAASCKKSIPLFTKPQMEQRRQQQRHVPLELRKLPVLQLDIVDDAAPCDSVLAPNPFLAILSKYGRFYQNLDCPATGTHPTTQPLEQRILKQDENDPTLEQLCDMVITVIRTVFGYNEGHAKHILLESMIQLLTNYEVTMELPQQTPLDVDTVDVDVDARSSIKVKLYLDDKELPIAKSRLEMIRLLSDAWKRQKGKIAEEETIVNDLTVLLEQGPMPVITAPAQTLAPLSSSRTTWHPHSMQYETSKMASCLLRLYNQNQIMTQRCSHFMVAAHDKAQEFELQWDCPLAALVRWIYGILCVCALLVLSSDMGLGETTKQRRGRRLRQMLQDPLLRKGIERDAKRRLKNDEAAVAKYMAEQDAKVAEIEAADADQGWKWREARIVAWKERVRYLWVLRKALVAALGVSVVLLVVDQPKAVVVLDSAMILVGTMGLSYVYMPESPEQQSKKGTTVHSSGLEEPLLDARPKGGSSVESA